MNKKTAIIIGAGPAGLTAAEQLLKRTNIKPVILETEFCVGGISKTVEHNGNRIDFGGHRFFSKSDKVMQWWQEKLQPEFSPSGEQLHDPEKEDKLMLFRNRLSRIYHRRQFFNYPITLSWNTIRSLGLLRSIGIGLSYFQYRFFPIREEKNLEDFFINRFGKRLYETFFKDYTEKVWGVPCTEISSSWGGQRIKGLSVSSAVRDAVANAFRSKNDIEQKNTETSLIRQFLYPKFGPGQMWESVAEEIKEKGGEIHLQTKAISLIQKEDKITGVVAKDIKTGKIQEFHADYILSTMPISELISGMNAPENIQQIASGLVYRDFITVGLLVNKLSIEKNDERIKDNWIYIQENDVMLGRLQIFNNWSPYLVKDPEKYWLGLEYFCFEGDEFWNMSDQEIIEQAIEELDKIKIARKEDVVDSVMYKVPKAYPAYFGTYDRLNEIREYTDRYPNLFLIGRNGMHKYNNQDHSMLTAMAVVDNIVHGRTDKSNIWNVNTELSYHESKDEK